ncbi:dihydroneopterin triphosphate diphosphatase [Variovorax paradoxus]|uniref:Dihydroneopterin triphosphate diphosphatase n=1 Tax=Variovorax paradoxus TaxID=34073 RepID=A0A5Q0MCJ1_VARPD|nr:dihydroneopterin triphosphate diphosphatase [Variovorax paradoxus]QFZ87351.1 dihydroneopterin triphosphate diphosphatase [Variovorax paradoxus]
MVSDPRPFKIPESVLVVIHTPALDVLLIRRADAHEFWQSVTGSKDALDEPLMLTAAREVAEETGIQCGEGTPLASQLIDWQLRNIYEIYPGWRSRYAPGITHNTEHLFGLCVPERLTPVLAVREHTDWQWLPYREAADACFSPSNAEAILLLPEFAR